MKHHYLIALVILVEAAFVLGICEDWTSCQYAKCAPPPNPCPKNATYLNWDNCGCCQRCSDKPTVGPCGVCGKDVICKEKEPVCGREDEIVTIDYCGCCKVCKTVVGVGGRCSACGQSSTVCEGGLVCVRGICQKPCF